MTSPRVDLPSITGWSLAARLASAPSAGPWALLCASRARIEAASAELREDLESLLEIPVEIVQVVSAQDLLDAVNRNPGSGLVLVVVDPLRPEEWRRVDGNRSRLERELPAVLVTDESSVPAMVAHAPNLWSWLGGAAWRGVPDTGLSDEAREQRLSALREHFGFDDAELVRRAGAGELAPEPDLAEWLVLIGESRLIGR